MIIATIKQITIIIMSTASALACAAIKRDQSILYSCIEQYTGVEINRILLTFEGFFSP